MRNEIKNLLDESTKDLSPKSSSLSLDIESAKKELEFAQAQKDHLLIFAEKSGIIGGVNFKSGQTVPPFTTLLSILSQKPDMIKAYIHENVYTQVELNQELMLASIADKRKKFSGRVISIGSRIIELFFYFTPLLYIYNIIFVYNLVLSLSITTRFLLHNIIIQL